MIWPRGWVAAAAFWNYIPEVDPTSSEFVQYWQSFNDQMIDRGVMACPSNCTCDELTACGVPYLNGDEL